jgi:photosystem II stability/assembly factor-like uncharacterized protein
MRRILAGLSLLFGLAWAAWLRVPAPVGDVYRLAASQGVLYAGSYTSGIYRKLPGHPWQRVLPADDFVSALSAAGSWVYAGLQRCNLAGYCQDLGIYASSNQGLTWHQGGLSGQYIDDLAATASDPKTLWAATRRGVYVSRDGASHFLLVLAVPALSVAVDPWNPRWVLVGTFTQGIFQSHDGGASWSQIQLGNGYIPAVAFGPGSLEYAGSSACDNSGCTGDVYRSLNGGATWQGAGLGAGIARIRVNPQIPNEVALGTYVDGVYLSTNSGASYISINPSRNNYDVTDLAFWSGKLYAELFEGGLFRWQ